MRSLKIAAMNEVVRDLHEAEVAFDDALTAIAKLSAKLPQARLQAKIAATVGQAALDNVLAACSLMGQARGKLVETHNQLNQVKAEIGLATVAAGGGYEKPLSKTFVSGAANEDIAA